MHDQTKATEIPFAASLQLHNKLLPCTLVYVHGFISHPLHSDGPTSSSHLYRTNRWVIARDDFSVMRPNIWTALRHTCSQTEHLEDAGTRARPNRGQYYMLVLKEKTNFTNGQTLLCLHSHIPFLCHFKWNSHTTFFFWQQMWNWMITVKQVPRRRSGGSLECFGSSAVDRYHTSPSPEWFCDAVLPLTRATCFCKNA